MEKHIHLVSLTFEKVVKNMNDLGYRNCNEQNFIYKGITIKTLDGVGCNKKVFTFGYYKELFKNFTLSELRDVLYLLVPFSTNESGGNSSDCNTLGYVKMAIKYIEKDLFTVGQNDDVKNNIDLINENIALKNKCQDLQEELNLIRKIINKTS